MNSQLRVIASGDSLTVLYAFSDTETGYNIKISDTSNVGRKQIYDDVVNIVENRDVVKEMSKKSIANRIVNDIFVNTYLLNKFEEKSAEKQAKNIA